MREPSKFRVVVSNYWQPVLGGLSLALFCMGVLFYRLASLNQGATVRELSAISTADNLDKLVGDPLNLLFKVPNLALKYFDQSTLFSTRLVSVLFNLGTALLIFYTLRRWYNRRVALLGLILTISSSWLLAYGRLATADITYPFLVAAGLAYGVWTRHTKHSGITIMFGVLLVIAYLYTPGMIWPALAAAIWQRRLIMRRIAEAPRATVFIIAGLAASVTPLVLAAFKDPSLIQHIAGLSDNPVGDIGYLGIRFVDIIQQLIINGQTDPALGLVGAALLDYFTAVMIVTRLIVLIKQRKLDRFKVMVGSSLLLSLLIAANGGVPIVVLLPIAYLLAGGGINYMLESWFKVFPRNPLARWGAISMVSLAVGLTAYYHLQRYFVAWPKAAPTATVFHNNLVQ